MLHILQILKEVLHTEIGWGRVSNFVSLQSIAVNRHIFTVQTA